MSSSRLRLFGSRTLLSLSDLSQSSPSSKELSLSSELSPSLKSESEFDPPKSEPKSASSSEASYF